MKEKIKKPKVKKEKLPVRLCFLCGNSISDYIVFQNGFVCKPVKKIDWRNLKMKINIDCWINDEAEEYIMNLASQGFYSELQEFIVRLTDAFNKSLYLIAGRGMGLE